jgi:chromosome segregation ATPase
VNELRQKNNEVENAVSSNHTVVRNLETNIDSLERELQKTRNKLQQSKLAF